MSTDPEREPDFAGHDPVSDDDPIIETTEEPKPEEDEAALPDDTGDEPGEIDDQGDAGVPHVVDEADEDGGDDGTT